MRTIVLLLALGFAARADAQGLPSEPITFGGGRVVLGGEATGTVAQDDPGFFNYTDYEYSLCLSIGRGSSACPVTSTRI